MFALRCERLTPRPNIDAEVAPAYEQYLRDQWLRSSLFASAIAASLVPVFALLDFFVYPEWFQVFLLLRIGCSLIIVSLAWIVSRRLPHLAKSMTVVVFLIIQSMILFMIAVTDGARSTYYAGLNLTVIAIGLLLPAKESETVVFCLVTYAGYFVVCWYNQAADIWVDFLGNIFFLVSTGVIASFSSHFLEQRRYQEFRLTHQLEQKNLQLADMDRQKSQFFANISHELRTPLTLILAPVQDLLEGRDRLPDRVAVRLAGVRDNALRLLKLVNDLLDVIRLEEGQDNLLRSRVELHGLLRGLVDGMIHLADMKGIDFEYESCPERLVVQGDARALEKVFVNVIGNALKFTDPGGAVRVVTSLRDGNVQVLVEDSGVGITESEQALVFERFRQADGTATRRYRGTGLGLALVKDLTERMGGAVLIESQLGVGTKEKLRFAALETEQGELFDAEAQEDPLENLHRLADFRGGLSVDIDDPVTVAGADSNDGSRASVLVVEDEPGMRSYLTEVLQGDYQVLQARDGREGLRLALEREPDLIVLDLMLPEMDGLEVCRRIRSDAKPRPSRIMLLTARADEQSKLTALENGANDFLTKPFSTVEVLTRLRNLLENARLERDLAARNARLEQTLRDLEATQAQLIQSEKLNALGSLSAGLLHEINNPLNYSLTALQLLGSDPSVQGDELMREIVGDIQEGMNRIRTIVSDLRAFAYPTEAEKQGAFDLNEAVEAALRFTAHELKGIEVIQALPAPALVLGSKSHLTQVLINLLANAAKAIGAVTDGRPGCIRIEGEERQGRLWVRVSDNGVGMNEQTLGRIFDPFFTTRDVGEGMGLGLSICHTIVSNHQGRLTATSRVGEGSELSFDLAMADAEPAKAPHASDVH
jgi:signal transduction histidine kinase